MGVPCTFVSYGHLNATGFTDSSFAYPTGGNAICLAGIVEVPVVAPTTYGTKILYDGPAYNCELTESINSPTRRGAPVFREIMGNPTLPRFRKHCRSTLNFAFP